MIEFLLDKELAKRNMPRIKLAEITGIRPDTITALCNGSIKRIPVSGLDKICYALGCDLSDIMSFTDKEYYVTTKSGRPKYGPDTYSNCEQYLNNLDATSAKGLIIKQVSR